MKLKYKYVELRMDKYGDRIVWNHKYGYQIGVIGYNQRWRLWEYFPDETTAYTADCMEDIAQILRELKDVEH